LILLAAQVLVSASLYHTSGNPTLQNVGWLVGMCAGIFGVWPMIDLRRKGGPQEGKDYAYTTRLVESGVYAIVRHPQYLSFALLSIFLALVVQQWLVFLLGAAASALVCIGIVPQADQANLVKFGSDYQLYMQRVPGLNPVEGILRLLRRNKMEEGK
jgi:protein-S-isoprenylcysteine O-methyltransferase Ste14